MLDTLNGKYSRVSSRRDEVQKSMDTVVAEAGITLDTRLLCENVVVLPLEVTDDLLEAMRNRQ